ncbi:MAG: hypothetical protein IMY72_10535 [Bacteroidetes bacterium]|nr:hypothetical protein [Bacteroidota bacterium]
MTLIKKSKILILLLLVFISCKNLDSNKEKTDEKKPLPKNILNKKTDNYTIVADTIVYGVILKNSNPEDYWTEECLRNIDRKKITDIIFKAIYEGRITAYDYFENTAFTIDEIKNIEKKNKFNRDRFAQIQFNEEWLIDEINLKMEKRVTSIILGYELYDKKNKVKAYSAAFKIYLNK